MVTIAFRPDKQACKSNIHIFAIRCPHAFRRYRLSRLGLGFICFILIAGTALALRLSAAPGTDMLVDDASLQVDISQADEGYITVTHAAAKRKLMLRIRSGERTETYTLKNDGTSEVYPLTCGSGSYTVSVYENISGNDYAQAYSGAFDVQLADENICYTYPNQYVWYTADSAAVAKSQELCADLTSDKDKINAVWQYVCTRITYDYIASLKAPVGYLPDVDVTLATHKGICFDIAALTACLLRAQDIPTQLVTGILNDTGQYHAWNRVLVDGEWLMLDATLGVVGDSSNYLSQHSY